MSATRDAVERQRQENEVWQRQVMTYLTEQVENQGRAYVDVAHDCGLSEGTWRGYRWCSRKLPALVLARICHCLGLHLAVVRNGRVSTRMDKLPADAPAAVVARIVQMLGEELVVMKGKVIAARLSPNKMKLPGTVLS